MSRHLATGRPQNRRSDAIKAYGAALQLAPHDVEARTNLAMQLFINGQVEEAIAHTQRALQDKPTVHALFNLGLFYLSRGEIDKAITTYAQAVEQFGAATGEKIGAVHNLKNLANKGIQVEAVREIVETHWRQLTQTKNRGASPAPDIYLPY